MNLSKIISRKMLFYTLAGYFLFQFTKICCAEEEEKVYRPYPVVFVHGFNSSRGNAWKETIEKLTPFYTKYEFPSEQYYFPYMDYGVDNHGYCKRIASKLRAVINSALISMAYMKPPVPESKRKVIIVCHSFGGLVSRYMLNSLNSKYVYKVIFLGTPHIGSPLASAGWLIYDNTKKDSGIKKDRETYASKSKNVNGELSNRETKLYNDLVDKIDKVIEWDEDFIGFVNKYTHIELDRPAIEQMRVPASISCKTELEAGGVLFNMPYKSTNPYDGDKTFLATTALTNPGNKRTLWGTGGIVGWAIQKIVNGLISDCPHIFSGFPYGHSLGDLSGGDGIVTYKSQTELGKEYKLKLADHMEETLYWEEILQAIDDDPPEILKIEAFPADWRGWNEDKKKNAENKNKYYIIIGIKEYLLADIEIMELTLDHKQIEIASSKPYEWTDKWHRNKEFLRSRPAPFKNKDSSPYKLKPGEFFVEVEMTPGIHELRIKVQNPAKKTASAKQKFSRPWVAGEYFAAGSFPWTIDLPTYDQYEDKDGDGIPGPDVVPEVGSLSFTAKADVKSDPNAPKTAKITAGVYVYKYKKTKKTVKGLSSGGSYEAEIEVITPVPDRMIYPFINGVYSLSGGEHPFSGLEWAGEGNEKEGLKYPVFIKVELVDNEGIQGLLYTNWQDNGGWENDVILGDPTFMQTSPVFKDRYDFALNEINKLEKEFKVQVGEMKQKCNDVGLDNLAAKLKANGLKNKNIYKLVLKREKDIYKQLQPEIKRLEHIKNAQIESIWTDLLMNMQLDNNNLQWDNLQKHLSLVINKSDKIPYNNLHLNSISVISIVK